MTYNFNEVIQRKGTNSIKYDFAAEKGKPADVLPLWVADMDFQAPKEVLEQLSKAVDHGIFGYTGPKESYFAAVQNWFIQQFQWQTQKDWIVMTPGVVFAVAAAVQAFSHEGDGILIQQPVYYPFGNVIRSTNRVVVNNPLSCRNGKYEIDFQDFERKIMENNVKVFVLCSPHNPVGRVWQEEELKRMADICLKNNVLIVSDEIHCDFIWAGHKHTVLAMLGEAYAQNAVICTAPSKTFNLAGLQASNIFIPNKKLRLQFEKQIAKTGYGNISLPGIVACETAYAKGRDWYLQVKEYIWQNIRFTGEYVQKHMPGVKMIEPEGTYLVWLDFRQLDMSEEERENTIVNKAGLWLDSGGMFGEEGHGFERINVACPRTTLQVAMDRLRQAFFPVS